jgi:hypothetical protein
MAVPQNKDELLKAINGNFDKLRRELADVPHNVVRDKGLEGHAKGTMMSISDLVAYLVG